MDIKNSDDEASVGPELTLYLTTSTPYPTSSTIRVSIVNLVRPIADPKMLLLLHHCRSTLATLVVGVQITYLTHANDLPC